MTQEEKFKEAKRLYETANADQKYVLESLFPELTESEDERVRKEILEYFSQFENGELRGVGISSWISWLEKQGQKPYGQRNECLDCQFNYAGECKGSCTMKRGEQKPTDKVEPKFKIGDTVKSTFSGIQYYITDVHDYYYTTDTGCIIMFNAQDNFELYKQNPAWSEEDETTKNNISHIIRQYDKISKRENKPCWYIGDCLLWMQNIKDRVQPKQEWSEDDEKKRSLLISILEVNHPNGYFKVNPANTLNMEAMRTEELVSWLKSIRPQNRWKPSEEQMKALDIAIRCGIQLGSWEEDALKSLKEQLKKI